MSEKKNKIILITGSSGYLGNSLCERFLELNFIVVGLDIKQKKLLKNKNFIFIKTDLTDVNKIEKAIDLIKSKFNSINLIINNARPHLTNNKLSESMKEWDLAHAVLLKAPAQIIIELSELLITGKGSVINISSTNARTITHQPLGYHIAKAGIEHLTRFFADKLGESGVRVNAVSPGVISENKGKYSYIEEEIIPLKRPAKIQEIVDLILFLSSEKASYINGQNITIDGGMGLKCPFYAASKLSSVKKDIEVFE